MGLWPTTRHWVLAPQTPGQGSLHFWLMHAKLDGQSLLRTHSGRQLGTTPIIPSWHPHWAWLLITWHLEFGPKHINFWLNNGFEFRVHYKVNTTWWRNARVGSFLNHRLLWKRWKGLTTNKWIACKFPWTVANWVVIDDPADSILAANPWTRIPTFLVDTGQRLRAFSIRLKW
jgi:hypothetical protein